jgi:hypothetical protein
MENISLKYLVLGGLLLLFRAIVLLAVGSVLIMYTWNLVFAEAIESIHNIGFWQACLVYVTLTVLVHILRSDFLKLLMNGAKDETNTSTDEHRGDQV